MVMFADINNAVYSIQLTDVPLVLINMNVTLKKSGAVFLMPG